MLEVVRRTSEVIFMPLTVGGGIRTLEDIRGSCSRRVATRFRSTPRRFAIPTWSSEAALRFGSQCIVVNIDPKRVDREGEEFWEVHVNGGRVPTGLEAVEWAREAQRVGSRRNCADIDGCRRHSEWV